jgi:DNA-binding transcriptional regulator YiaG
MTTKSDRKYLSQATAAIHEGVSDLYNAGAADEKTMREFDERCLVDPEGQDFEAPKVRKVNK